MLNTYQYVFWMQVVTIGAIVKADLIEYLCCHADDGAVVVPAVGAAADHPLAQGHALWPFGYSSRLQKGKIKQTISAGTNFTTGFYT